MSAHYITFGQDHVHVVDEVTYDKDCVAVITAPTHAKARQLAIEFFGRKFCTSYAASDCTAEDLIRYP